MMRNLFLLFALMPLMANADIQPDARGNWFIEGRYQKSLSEAVAGKIIPLVEFIVTALRQEKVLA